MKTLIDTGSEVSTVTETLYRRHLSSLPLQQSQWFSLKAASGLSIPYLGIVEGKVNAFGMTTRGSFLVVEDRKDPTTRRLKNGVPGILGMNILPHVVAADVPRTGNVTPSWLLTVVQEVRVHNRPVQE
jgi:hypothetical protein